MITDRRAETVPSRMSSCGRPVTLDRPEFDALFQQKRAAGAAHVVGGARTPVRECPVTSWWAVTRVAPGAHTARPLVLVRAYERRFDRRGGGVARGRSARRG